MGVKKSVYKKPYLREAWDEIMYKAADQIGPFMLARLRRAIEDGAT